ncbi:UDP-N-acetylmuramoyl-tripeptide--D-alanyl-D-alanine ligase [Vibrio sp. S4M6]|uniref:UDP-N-acetylmuramoyl-tripeptide--D-alanyl-D- alanine ligase n=1 Tax=Vibrio sinus TaxID=2946865 RepID=UPI00202A5906|nr:UDP-N-acetylmuramoyl-tripeptide--D-alanyl-D-alanine ligase [Vibrio sinus]MCL9781475.1 UDP-N-acetylmuramoyl-tripeptide--D-alanyl-D-alanine ligase [Vibrio sinus]
MIKVSLQALAQILDAKLVGHNTEVESISTDTRKIASGALFVALVGERFDAHQFVENAVSSGACAVLVSSQQDISVPQLVVEDTKIALGKMAKWVHQECQTKTAAITGSCGKTTVKEMLSSILAQIGQVMYTDGNFNNEVGVPLTLLRSTPEDQFAVVELGANHIGEIAYTTELVKPDVALVNNVAEAHLEGFGSLEGVKKAKGEIYQGLSEGSSAIINLDSQGESLWEDVLSDKNVLTFSATNQQADFYPSSVRMNEKGEADFVLHTPKGSTPVQLGIVGDHNVSNALAASALALEMGATLKDIQTGLAHLSNVKGRVEVINLTESITLIDDSYNASVPAMKAAIDLLHCYQGKKWLILGYMAELGHESEALHREVAEHAAQYSFDHVLTFGDPAQVISQVCHGNHFASHNELISYINHHLLLEENYSHTLLVKGANSARMFEVAASLKETYS